MRSKQKLSHNAKSWIEDVVSARSSVESFVEKYVRRNDNKGAGLVHSLGENLKSIGSSKFDEFKSALERRYDKNPKTNIDQIPVRYFSTVCFLLVVVARYFSVPN